MGGSLKRLCAALMMRPRHQAKEGPLPQRVRCLFRVVVCAVHFCELWMAMDVCIDHHFITSRKGWLKQQLG